MVPLLERQIEIITLLLLKDDYCIADDLADVLSVSNRTIRNDFTKIKMFLKAHGAELKAEPHKGYKIVADMDCKQRILNHLDLARPLGQKEIIKAISVVLLSVEHATYDNICAYLDISKQTLVKYMGAVEELFLENGISLNKVKGKGLSIEGSEIVIRDFMKQILTDSQRSNFIITLAEESFLKSSSLTIARQIIKDIETKGKLHFYEQRKLELLLSYSLYRISIGKSIEKRELDASETVVADYSEYCLFYDNLKQLPLDEAEKQYLVSILLETKVKHLNKKYNNDSDAKQLAKFLMKKMQLLHPFSKEKREIFLNGLSSHLNVALYRIRNNIPIQNELLEQIKISISLIYLYTKQQLLSQEEKYDVIFDESEIAYVAMYLASAFETSIKLDRRIKVLIECSFGTTTSAILDSRIRQLVTECEVVGPFSTAEAKEYLEKESVDLVVTTHEGTDYDYPTIIVNPLLNLEDADYIRSRIFQLSHEKICQSFLSSYIQQDNNKARTVYIKDVIKKENIQICESCSCWEQAIQLAATPLVEAGQIEQRYVIAMIEAVNKLGTYMVLLPETAFVHAGTDSGIYEDCCSLLVIKKPIVLGNVNGKTVRNMIVLGVKNREQLTMLDLVSVLQKEENRALLASENIDVDTIVNLHN